MVTFFASFLSCLPKVWIISSFWWTRSKRLIRGIQSTSVWVCRPIIHAPKEGILKRDTITCCWKECAIIIRSFCSCSPLLHHLLSQRQNTCNCGLVNYTRLLERKRSLPSWSLRAGALVTRMIDSHTIHLYEASSLTASRASLHGLWNPADACCVGLRSLFGGCCVL